MHLGIRFFVQHIVRHCGIWVISRDFLEFKGERFACTFQILGGLNLLCKIFVQTHSETFVPLFVMFPTTLQPFTTIIYEINMKRSAQKFSVG